MAFSNRDDTLKALQIKGLLSIIVPVFNEEEFLAASLTNALNAPLPEGLTSELVAIDDGSTDGSGEILREFAANFSGRVRIFAHPRNMGKGSAIRRGIQEARGEYGIIQDSDLEYDPRDYPRLLGPLLSHYADVVYGSRFLISGERRVLYYWHSLANRLLTTAANMAADVNLTDVETCYKAFRMSLAKSIPLRNNRFGIDAEMTIKFAKRDAAIYEVPINYHGRTYEEGKKIGFKDAVEALGVILRSPFTNDIYNDHGAAILNALASTRRFNKWMADTVRPWVQSNVLEIGAGIGNMTAQLSRGRKRYVATDLEEEHLARLKSRFRTRPNVTTGKCDLCNPEDFRDFREQFDTVVCLNVLEHVPDPASGLRNIYSVLKPNGRAIVLVPQGQSIYGTLDKELGHYLRYSEQQLRDRMEAAGFHVQAMLHFNRVTRPGWYWNGRILKRRHFGRLQLLLFDVLVPFWKRLDLLLPWPSVSLIAIGVKQP